MYGYNIVINWILIGSMGDPKTWAGGESVAIKKGSADGLAGCLVDLNVLQEILYIRPSGHYNEDGFAGYNFTNHLQSVLLADSNSVVGRDTIL